MAQRLVVQTTLQRFIEILFGCMCLFPVSLAKNIERTTFVGVCEESCSASVFVYISSLRGSKP
jgi:hypothetical protein